MMTEAIKPDKTPSFETNLARLDTIVRQLEQPDLPLEQALKLYEEGTQLSEVCQRQLDEAEGRVEILRRKSGGQMVPAPFEPEKTETS
jgi:exodeoxyribonuclease VII small subunit